MWESGRGKVSLSSFLHIQIQLKLMKLTSITCMASHAPSSKCPLRPCAVFEPSSSNKNGNHYRGVKTLLAPSLVKKKKKVTFLYQKASYKTFIIIFPHVNWWNTTFIIPTNLKVNQNEGILYEEVIEDSITLIFQKIDNFRSRMELKKKKNVRHRVGTLYIKSSGN